MNQTYTLKIKFYTSKLLTGNIFNVQNKDKNLYFKLALKENSNVQGMPYFITWI